MRRFLSWLFVWLALAVPAVAQVVALFGGSLEPTLDCNFVTGTPATPSGSIAAGPVCPAITFSRASTATDGLYTDVAGRTPNSYSTNIARITSGGLIIEEQRTNSLLNSGTPATQTTASLGTGTYTLWVNGTGSATSSAGTATGSGFGAATNGTPNTFTLTGAGTVTVTVSGSLNYFQLENGAFATSYIPTTGAAATRAGDQAYIPAGAWLNLYAGTIVGEFDTARGSGSGTDFGLSDGTFNNSFYENSGGVTELIAGVGHSIGTASLNSPWSTNKVASAYDSAGIYRAVNGGAYFASSVPGSPPYPWSSRLSVGCSPWALDGQTDGHIRRIIYFPRVLSNSEQQQRTR